jgi:hypothetical protein
MISKGPFTYEERPYSTSGSNRFVVVQKETGDRIATVSLHGVPTKQDSEDNARLLAASWEMLEFLKKIVNPKCNIPFDTFVEATSLISRAEGR